MVINTRWRIFNLWKKKLNLRNKKNILFIYPIFSSFVSADYEILSEKYNVVKYQYVHKKKISTHLLNQIKLKFWLFKNIIGADAVYVWFADYHSLLPILFAKLLQKKSFIVLGGYDVTFIPSLDYGSLNNSLRAFCTKQSLKNATVNLAVSNYVANQAIEIVTKAKVELIYNGVNLSKFKSEVGIRKNKILTVGSIDSIRRIKLKGIDVFVKVAIAMPEYEFAIVGITQSMQKELGDIPNNLVMVDQVQQDELFRYYNESKVYCQFSIVEAFCLALAEAMACGCTGVVTDAGALPEVIGDSGFIVDAESMIEIKEKIEEALKLSEKSNFKSVKIIKDNFDIEYRKEKLFEVFETNGV